MKQVGTLNAFGYTWPTYATDAYEVKVRGEVAKDERFDAERLQEELQHLLSPYGLTASVEEVVNIGLSPEDQAEYERLAALAAAGLAA